MRIAIRNTGLQKQHNKEGERSKEGEGEGGDDMPDACG